MLKKKTGEIFKRYVKKICIILYVHVDKLTVQTVLLQAFATGTDNKKFDVMLN